MYHGRGTYDLMNIFIVLGLDDLVLWQVIMIAVGVMVVTAGVVQFFAVPRIKEKIEQGTNFLRRRCGHVRIVFLSQRQI